MFKISWTIFWISLFLFIGILEVLKTFHSPSSATQNVKEIKCVSNGGNVVLDLQSNDMKSCQFYKK